MASRIDRLEQLANLRRIGAITEVEFEEQKAKVIGTSWPINPENQEHAGASSGKAIHPLTAPVAAVDPKRYEQGAIHFLSGAEQASGLFRRVVGRFPVWSDLSGLAKLGLVLVAPVALWFTWLVLKYLGLVVGIVLLIYSVKNMNAERATALETSGSSREEAQQAADKFRFLVGAAIVLIATSTAVDYIAFPLRRGHTEIAQADYDNLCTGGNKFENLCRGKFIVWNGIVESIGSDYVRTKINDDLTVDIKDIDPSRQTLVEGQKIQASGWLVRKNWIFPDVSNGQIEPLETTETAEARSKAEEAASAAAAERQQSSDIASKAYQSGKLQGMLGTLNDCKPYASDQTAYGACLNQSSAARGWQNLPPNL